MRLVSLVVAAVIGAVLALVAVAASGRLAGGWFDAETRTESSTIIEQVKLVAKLQTVEYHGAHTVKLDKEDWKGKSTAVYLLEGTVAASVDLQQMSLYGIRDKALRQAQDYLQTFVGALGSRAEFG